MLDAEYIRSGGFWENREAFVAGEWEGADPVVPDGSVLFRTSGSTGEPKWVVLGKDSLLISARAVNEWLGVGSNSEWGLALPLNHVGGFGVVARAYSAGCGLVVFEGKWDARRFTEWLESEGVTHVSLVPTQLHDLVQGGFRAPDCLKAVVVGGGRLGGGLGQAARDAAWPVLASYGMTEACSQIATQELELLDLSYVKSPLKTLPIWNVRRTEAGILEVQGDALFSGTLEKREGEWAFKKHDPGWFATSDRVCVEGDCLIPEGRADSVVKIMGELVDVEAVEKRFLKMATGRVREGGFATVAVKDARREHVLVAVFEKNIEKAVECFDEYQRLAPGVERFDRHIVVDYFPRTSLGKLKRGELAEICRSVDS
ncbi:MAG: AMP-binding protein [Verrucomicrobia bacterium]|nr:AMP-binding protein [Verrucomicrobiota bacterium]